MIMAWKWELINMTSQERKFQNEIKSRVPLFPFEIKALKICTKSYQK